MVKIENRWREIFYSGLPTTPFLSNAKTTNLHVRKITKNLFNLCLTIAFPLDYEQNVLELHQKLFSRKRTNWVNKFYVNNPQK